MLIKFWKYQATGNDFILLDGRNNLLLTTEQIKFLCDRHWGIGSDGVIIIRESDCCDFKMQFFNPDGSEASFCGNGGRCIAKFAYEVLNFSENLKFIAKDGKHNAHIKGQNVRLQMQNVDIIKKYNDLIYLNTGTHHTVIFTEQKIENINEKARLVRYDRRFAPEGTNVNFVKEMNGKLFVRTYEKGVEAETLSCGTGVVASAIAYSYRKQIAENSVEIQTQGGQLTVEFKKQGDKFSEVFLTGKALQVFEGQIKV